MPAHSPQLPTDGVATAAPKPWKKHALLLLLVVAIAAALAAFLVPKKQVEGRNAPHRSQHRPASPAYSHPVNPLPTAR